MNPSPKAIEAAYDIRKNAPEWSAFDDAKRIQSAMDEAYKDGYWQCGADAGDIAADKAESRPAQGIGNAELVKRMRNRPEDEWPEDYDLTSFLHGDKTAIEELREANDNLFKIANKYRTENKRLKSRNEPK